jgi:hypothetical protein
MKMAPPYKAIYSGNQDLILSFQQLTHKPSSLNEPSIKIVMKRALTYMSYTMRAFES